MVLTFLNLVVVSGLLVGLITGSYDQYRESFSGDVIITPANNKDHIENSPALIRLLEAHPYVEVVSPRYGVGAQVLGTLDDLPDKDASPNQVSARISGIDPLAEEKLSRFSRFVKYGQPLSADQEGYILIGANLLKKYSSFADANIPGLTLLEKVDIGSKVRVDITTEDGPVRKIFIVKGIVKSKIDEISTRMFVLDREVKRLLPVNKDEVQEIAIKTKPLKDLVLVSELKQFMGDYQARIQTSQEAIPSFLRDIESTMSILGNALSSFALVVAAITVFIVIFINAVTKRKFIGIMKGIGISPRAIQVAYVIQALFYGVVGSTIGLALTFGFLEPFFRNNPIDFPFSDGILAVTASGAMIRVAILLVVTIFAGYLPATLIVRKNTLDSILGR